MNTQERAGVEPESTRNTHKNKIQRVFAKIPKTVLVILAAGFVGFIVGVLNVDKELGALQSGFFVGIGWSAIAAYIAAIVISGLKGKPFFATIGVLGALVPGVSIWPIVGAIRLAKPNSRWACKYYDDKDMQLALARFPNDLPSDLRGLTPPPPSKRRLSKRQEGWIAATVVFAAVLTIITGLVVSSKSRTHTTPTTSSAVVRTDFESLTGLGKQTPGAKTPYKGSSETLYKGHAFPYSIKAPTGWRETKQEPFDLGIQSGSLFVGVIAEEEDLGNVDTVVDFSQQLQRKELGEDAKFSPTSSVVVDGRTWRTFQTEYKEKGVPFTREQWIYTGPEGTFQLFGGTYTNVFSKNVGKLREVMRTFKFPPGSSSSSTPAPGQTEQEVAATPAPSPSPTPRETIPLADLAEKIAPSVVTITAYNSNWKPLTFGTGFFIGEQGNITTNWHVIAGASHISAKTNSGESLLIKTILFYDADLDIAVVSLGKWNGRKYPGIGDDYYKTPPRVGTNVVVLGNPEGLEQSLSQGIVSGIRSDKGRTMIQITAPISEGSSGSPVLDERGVLIGIATSTKSEGQNLNFARSFSDLATLSAKRNVRTMEEVRKERYWALANSAQYHRVLAARKAKDIGAEADATLDLLNEFPDVSDAHGVAGVFFIRVKKHKLAVDELNTAILLDPSHPDFWKGLSLNYTATGETQLSKQCADIAAQLSAKKAKPVLK